MTIEKAGMELYKLEELCKTGFENFRNFKKLGENGF